MSSETGTPITHQTTGVIVLDSKPGTGTATGKLRIWLGEKELHPNHDCIRVRGEIAGSGAVIRFAKGSHIVGGEPEVHDVYGEVTVEKNGTAIASNVTWTPSNLPITSGDVEIFVATDGVHVELSAVKVDDIIKFKFTKLYWLSPNGRSHELDHGDPNVVIKVVNDLSAGGAFPDC